MANWRSAYEEHGAAILAYFNRRLRNQDDAEDLCQETFARALGREASLRQVEKMRPYLFTTARNLLINHVTRRNIVRSVSDVEDVDLEQVADRSWHDPEASTRWNELSTRLDGLLRKLPPEHRTAFELGVLQRLLYSEIAMRTGWSLAKVKINVYRARRVLIDGLRDYRPEHTSKRIEGGKEES